MVPRSRWITTEASNRIIPTCHPHRTKPNPFRTYNMPTCKLSTLHPMQRRRPHGVDTFIGNLGPISPWMVSSLETTYFPSPRLRRLTSSNRTKFHLPRKTKLNSIYRRLQSQIIWMFAMWHSLPSLRTNNILGSCGQAFSLFPTTKIFCTFFFFFVWKLIQVCSDFKKKKTVYFPVMWKRTGD